MEIPTQDLRIGNKGPGHCGTELDLYIIGCLQLRGKKVEVN
jgi:hypothetical protein